MNQEKNNFLDKSSLIAIAALGLCWIGWDIYMKKKYPRPPKGPAAQSQAPPAAAGPPPPKKTAPAAAALREKPEKIFFYSGRRAELELSSKGMGIKKLLLKDFFDSEGKNIVFQSAGEPLFASFFLDGGAPVPFDVRETAPGSWTGIHRSRGAEIIKTAALDEEAFVLKAKIQIKRSGGFPAGVSEGFSHALPPKDTASWHKKLFFLYGHDMFKGFALADGGAERILEEDLAGGKAFPRISVLAAGGKFFGAALVSQSQIFPSGSFKKSARRAKVRGDYRLLDGRPAELEYLAFLGPKSLDALQPLGAEGWLDFGFFGWLARPLLRILKFLFAQTQNWGLAVVLLTLLVRLCLFPINLKSYKSMKAMQKLQPQLKKLRERHKGEPQKLNAEWAALLKSNKASPFGGCLPLFFQLPVFVALYRVLGESAELYQAPFVWWIKDLSQKDPLYLLPVLSGLVFFAQQKISPMSLPKAQARLLALAPLVFTVFMLSLPSGLTLYLFVSGLFGLVQQAFFVRIKEESGGGPPDGPKSGPEPAGS